MPPFLSNFAILSRSPPADGLVFVAEIGAGEVGRWSRAALRCSSAAIRSLRFVGATGILDVDLRKN